MSDANALVDKLNEMAVYWSGDDYDTCREAAEKLESYQRVFIVYKACMDNLEKRAKSLQAEIDALKSDDPFGWLFEEKHISPRLIYNNRLMGSPIGPSDDFLEQNKDKLTPLFKSVQPNKSSEPVAWIYDYYGAHGIQKNKLTIHKSYFDDFVLYDKYKNIRPLYLRSQPNAPLLSAKAIADTWNKHAVKNELYSIVIDNFARDIESQVRSQYES